MPKTYIVVTPFFPSPGNWRGAYCFDFVRALVREVNGTGLGGLDGLGGLGGGWRVEVFVPGDGSDYEYQGVKVRTFKTRQLPSNVLPFLFRRYNERSFLKKVREALGRTTANKGQTGVSICHAHTANFAIYALAAKRAFGCKALLHHHDLVSFGLNNGRLKHCGLYNRILARQLKRLHEQIDCHVFISRLCKKSFETFPNIDWLDDDDYSAQARGVKGMEPVRVKRSIVLHNGVDTAIFNREVEVEGEGGQRKDSSVFVIGCVGNIEREKGQYDLLCALKILKDAGKYVRCLFVGSGPDLERCRDFAQEYGLDVEFIPEMRHELMPDFYRRLDLFVLPTWLDGFGCVYTEAYACGVPFVASTNAGVEDMMPESERDLWLCAPHDVEGLADKISHFIEHKPTQTLTGDYAIDKLVSRFSEEVIGHG